MITIVSEEERNVFDINAILDTLYSRYKIQNKFLTFDDVNKNLVLTDGKLFFEDKEIAVVYFREGYDSSQYTTEADWQAREKLELSVAIKSPSVDLQLLTLK